jgi:phosphoribosylformylglycinamidine synthase
MAFLHDGRPPVVREATFAVRADLQTTVDASAVSCANFGDNLCAILGSLNVASKHWVIRQYDHEVQGGSVIKPLVGADNDGPGDAAVVRPVLDSRRGLVIGCGMNPHFGDIDPYHMATSSIDEAIRNCVAVGADPKKIAILDNFCWGHTDRPETLGSLVRAALGCRDLSIKYQTPFISGKDSLHNEFSFNDDSGARQTISIPSTLLISAMGQVEDVKTCTTMDLKASGNVLYQIGVTKDELGGSHWSLVTETVGGDVPQVDAESAMTTFIALHHAIESGLVRSCHDISEGGLAAAIAEMAFAGGLGAEVDVSSIDVSNLSNDLELVRLFSESNSRFVVEVTTDNEAAFESAMSDVAIAKLGSVNDSGTLTVRSADNVLISEPIAKLKSVWQSPLDL